MLCCSHRSLFSHEGHEAVFQLSIKLLRVTCISPLLKSPPTKSPPLDGRSTAYDARVYANCRLRTMETEMSTTRHAVDCNSLLTYNGDFTSLLPLVTTTELIDEASRSQWLVYFAVYHLNLQSASH